jgi:hypothetical protein
MYINWRYCHTRCTDFRVRHVGITGCAKSKLCRLSNFRCNNLHVKILKSRHRLIRFSEWYTDARIDTYIDIYRYTRTVWWFYRPSSNLGKKLGSKRIEMKWKRENKYMRIILNQETCNRRFNSFSTWRREDRYIFPHVPWTPQWENSCKLCFRISRKEKKRN